MEQVPLAVAAGRVLAEPALSALAVPPQDCAAMDGYALRAADTAGAGPHHPGRLPLLGGELTAGRAQVPPLAPGQAVRIMTGAPLPAGADAVVPWERAREEAGGLLLGEPVVPGSHVRRRGKELRPGAVCFPAGRLLTASEVGLLASAGCAAVSVWARPRVAVLATGSELRDLAEPAAPGREVVASNGYMLAAQVAEWGGLPDRRPPVPDDPEALARAIRSAEASVVVTTAGTGGGVHDFLTAAWAALRAEVVVPGVAIRPGQTTRVARLGERILLGLPGGPGAAWAAFHALVGPALWAWGGLAAEPLAVRAALAEAIGTEAGVTHLVRGRLTPAGEGWRFAPARTGATGVALLEGTDRGIAAGAVVRVEVLPTRPAPGTE